MENNVTIEGEIDAGFTSYWNKEIGKRYHTMTKTDKIIQAADRFDEVGYDQAELVSEKAEVSRSEILRIWTDNDIEIMGLHPNVKLTWEDLDSDQKDILAYYYHNKNNIDDLFNSETELYRVISHCIDRKTHISRDTVVSHKWLLKDDYRQDWVDEQEDEYTITTELLDEIAENSDKNIQQISQSEDMDNQETETRDDEVEEQIEEISEQQSMNPNNTITAEMDIDTAWNVISVLLENDKNDDAKELFISMIN